MTDAPVLSSGSRQVWRVAPALVLVFAVVGCAGEPEESDVCVETIGLECTPAYEPNYDAVYANLLGKTCGAASTGNVCHAVPTARGSHNGLVLANPDQSYDNLLGLTGGRAFVIPGNPECSVLIQRLESNDPGFRMPVGSAPLSLAERCVVRHWVAAGALRQ